VRAPKALKRPPWVVHVYGELQHGHYMPPRELAELAAERGDAYVDELGPAEDFQPEWSYGPYTEKQAKELAKELSRPEVAAREEISRAVALPMLRWLGRPEPLIDRMKRGDLS
jgi:hypothetical protein